MRLLMAAIVVFAALNFGTTSWQGSGLTFERNYTPGAIFDLAAPLRAAPGKSLVSFESGLAFCAPQTRLMQGYEMSEFSILPPISPSQQEYFRGISYRHLRRDIARADFVALRPMDFSCLRTAHPDLTNQSLNDLLSEFEIIRHLDSYGHYGGALTIYRRMPRHSKPTTSR